MRQKIVSFDKDEDGDWRALLACRHYQHVRHDPPLTVREWVTTEVGRESRVGHELDCRKCDDHSAPDL